MPGFLIVFLSSLINLIFVSGASAVTLDNDVYEEGKDIIVTARTTQPSATLIFFNTDTESVINSFGIEDPLPKSTIEEVGATDFSAFVIGKYSAVEIVFDGPPDCDQVSYSACIALSDFKNEFKFTIAAKGSAAASGGGGTVYTPNVELEVPLSGKLLSGKVPIQYKASDRDDEIGQKTHGLTQNPVSVYYGLSSKPYDWIVIAEQRSATGTLVWDTSQLPDGIYRLRLAVAGVDHDFRQIVIEDLHVDNTPPLFSVKTDPSFSKGELVEIEVESSEIFKKPPTVTVTQLNHEPIEVELTQDELGKKYKGIYTPISGFDGPAEISVKGEDLAGNKSEKVVAGDTFAIGIKPPRSPVIQEPRDTILVGEPRLVVSGTSFNADMVALKVNGGKEQLEKVQGGRFRFEHVELDPNFNKGKSIITVVSYDRGHNISEPTTFEIRINRAPEISLVEPRGRALKLNGTIQFAWKAFDFNEDPLLYQVELSDDGGNTWKVLKKDLKESEFAWDSTTVPDGSNYLFRTSVFDGLAKTYAQSRRVSILNNLPAIVLEASGDFFTAEESKNFKGVVRSKDEVLVKLEASLNGGKTWKQVLPEDGVWDETFEKFTLLVPELRTGPKELILRGFFAQGRVVLNAQHLKVFFDNRAPTISVETLSQKPLTNPFLRILGLARDNFSGIKSVEYTIDDSVWFQGSIVKGLETGFAEFEVKHPNRIQDGEHQVKIRVMDRAGNISNIKTQKIMIDATPPRIGSFVLKAGSTIVFPQHARKFEVLPNTQIQFLLAIAGNPKKTSLLINDTEAQFVFHANTKLWEGNFTFSGAPTTLKIETEDEAGNKVEREIAEIVGTETKTQQEYPRTFWQRIIDFFQRK